MKPLLLTVLALALFLGIQAGTKWYELDDSYSFDRYVKEFGKQYADAAEYKMRHKIFQQTYEQIRKQNSNPRATWRAGVNHLTDRTKEEFSRLLGYKRTGKPDTATLEALHHPYQGELSYDLSALPINVDWRDHGIITAVKDQGQCGSCWTFGTTETIESYWANHTGHLTDLSEQQILDCTPNPKHCGGSGGCNGGTTELAYAKLVELGGQTTEWLYPYISYFGATQACDLKNRAPYAKIAGYTKLPVNTYSPIVHHLATTGPLAINVDASTWSTYETGIFDSCNQKNPNIDHVVQLVGYGTGEGKTWWTVRNSWSPSWGENGYIRLKRSSDESSCGIDIWPGNGTGCDNGPATVKVCGTCGIWFDTSYPIISK